MDAWSLISEIVQRVEPPPPAETPLQEVYGWDSLKMVRMVLRLEEVLDRRMTESEIEGLNTVGDLENLLSIN